MKDTTIQIGIQILEQFKNISGYTNEQFLQYMNDNNTWEIFNNEDLVQGFMWAEDDDIVDIIGRYLPIYERDNIISRYNSRFLIN